MPSQPSAKRIAKARAGVIGSSSRFERLLRESGAFESLTPQEVVQLQHTIEQTTAFASVAVSKSAMSLGLRRAAAMSLKGNKKKLNLRLTCLV